MKDEYFVGEKRFETPTGISPTGKGVNECGRQQFEAWISSEPYSESVARIGENSVLYAGQYCRINVQSAWEAWQESRRTNDGGGENGEN